MQMNETNAALEKLHELLSSKTIYELRQIGREVGINSSTDKNKEPLIEGIMAIARGTEKPEPRNTRGAPPKSKKFDEEAVRLVGVCREYFLGVANPPEDTQTSVNGCTVKEYTATPTAEEYTANPAQGNSCEQPAYSPREGEEEQMHQTISDLAVEGEAQDKGDETFMGVLEFSDKFWFLRTKNYQISSVDDVFVHSSFVNRFHLKVGDFVVCKAKRRKENECPGVTFIVSVNGKRPESFGGRRPFESLVPCYPDKRYTLEGEDFTARIIDLFSPIGCGQRALIVSPPKAGKTTMLKSIACAITKHNPTAHVMVLLVDERPEEVTDIRRTVSGAEVIYSTFDKGEMHHIHSAMLSLERAKRLVEMGEDVVLLMDSITRLVRAFNATVNSGRILSGGLDPQALVEPRKFFGSARNIEGGGSLTIIATALVDTGSRLDDIIYEEFKSAGNMEIILSRDLAERRIFPAIDIKASGARKEELLLSPEELSTSHKLRGLLSNGVNTENLFAMIEKTQTNADLCQKADEWLKVYRNK